MTGDAKKNWRVVADLSAKYEFRNYNVRFQNESVILPMPLWQKIQKELRHRIHNPECVLRHLIERPLFCRHEEWDLFDSAIAIKTLIAQIKETPFAFLIREKR